MINFLNLPTADDISKIKYPSIVSKLSISSISLPSMHLKNLYDCYTHSTPSAISGPFLLSVLYYRTLCSATLRTSRRSGRRGKEVATTSTARAHYIPKQRSGSAFPRDPPRPCKGFVSILSS